MCGCEGGRACTCCTNLPTVPPPSLTASSPLTLVAATLYLQVPHFKGDQQSPELDVLVDDAHRRYMAGLQALWEEHKDTYARGRRRSLRIVE